MLEDKWLVWKAKSGDRAAFARIYDKYEAFLLNLAASLLNDINSAEDVLQEVFVTFAAGLGQFKLTGSLKSYLATCVANRARDCIRERQRRGLGSMPDDLEISSRNKGPLQNIIFNEDMQLLRRGLDELNYDQREVVLSCPIFSYQSL